MANLAEKTFRPSLPHAVTKRWVMPHEVFGGCIRFFDFLTILIAAEFAFLELRRVSLDPGNDARYAAIGVLGAIIFVFGMRRARAYTVKRLADPGWQVLRGFFVLGWTFSLIAALLFVTKEGASYSRAWMISWIFIAYLGHGVGRVALYVLTRHWMRTGRLARRVALIGTGDVAERTVAKFAAFGKGELALIGIFDDRTTRLPDAVGGHPVMGTTDDLIAIARTMPLDEIIIALPITAAQRIGDIVAKLRALPVDLRVCIDPIAEAFPIQRIGETGPVRVVEVVDRPLKHWSGITKALEDKILGSLIILLLLPVMALIALAIRLDSRGPVLFLQERFGLASKPIHVMKFRTMRFDAGDPTGGLRTVPGDPRVTRVGRFLRQWSLDELPQLFNVMRGDMSLVGPRPHAVAMKVGERLFHDAVAEYMRRHRVKPGMTGWAQVNGLRGEIDTIEKARQRVAYDLHYIESWSLWFDFVILAMTAWTVISRREAY